MSAKTGDNSLIFLISQPRAGSTLLQRIIARHPAVHTVSEPWLMLHPMYALRDEGYQAEYQAFWARSALRTFLQGLPEGEEAYFEGIRRMFGYLYGRALEESGKQYFLDKTPRYYLILRELYRAFPEAHYIILFRNPAAVLCSVINTWIGTNLFTLYHHGHDLIVAPRLLLEGQALLGDQAMVIRYEDLVQNPQDEVRSLCAQLELDPVPDIVEYGVGDVPDWDLGDQREIYHHVRPMAENAARWKRDLVNPQVWHLVNEYLQLLGPEVLRKMEYDYRELQQVLEVHRPTSLQLWPTFSLHWILDKPPQERRLWKRAGVRVVAKLGQCGLRGTASDAVRKAIDALSYAE